MSQGPQHEHNKLSWREGLFLVGPDPLTSPYYSSGALIIAGAGYTTPLFQLGLYTLLFLLAPIYIEAVLLTLSNGGTYVMTRYALSHLGKLAIVFAAVVGVIISFSYVATAIVSLLSYSHYVLSLVHGIDAGKTTAAALLSLIPTLGFGMWVMPSQWRKLCVWSLLTTAGGVLFSTMLPDLVVVMLPPLALLFLLNNYGLKESVRVSKVIFLLNLFVMTVTIVFALAYVMVHGVQLERFLQGARLAPIMLPAASEAVVAALPVPGGDTHVVDYLPGLGTLGGAAIPMAIGSSVLGASGVESVMNIPEELERPRRDVRRIYRWMLGTLLTIGGTISLLVFLVLSPTQLTGSAAYLVAELGYVSVAGTTGSTLAGNVWHVVIVAAAAMMLIGATNTGFAGARGLWVTMARDNLLPRAILTPNLRGAYERLHWLMLVAVLILAWQAGADTGKLERWYGASFGLVMFSGLVAFVLLRKYKAGDRRAYRAPFNVAVGSLRLPVAVLFGIVFITFALVGLYTRFSDDLGELRTLVTLVLVLVVAVLLGHNHRPIIRSGYQYFRRVIESVESDEIKVEARTIVVAVGSVRIGSLLRQATVLARAQTKATGVPYKQLVVFHMTKSLRREYVYRVQRDSIRPAGIEGNAIRIFTELTEIAPDDIKVYLALVPNKYPDQDKLHAAMATLVDFHRRHSFKGHIVMIGDQGVSSKDIEDLQSGLEGSTLVVAPT